MTTQDEGLICAYLLDGKGGGRSIEWNDVRQWKADKHSPIWVHLDRSHAQSKQWLQKESGLDPIVCEALLAEETRPRTLVVGQGLLAILRGVNLNPGADPDDMISVRLWVEKDRIITLRARRAMAIQDIRETIDAGTGPKGPADFLVALTVRLIDRMGPVLAGIDEAIDDAEEQVLEAQSHELRMKLGRLRREPIGLRRYIAPQRDAIARLQVEVIPWLDDLHRARLREVSDRVTRYVEDLDALRERAAVIQEELAGRLAEQMNRTMYILSLVAAVFLPLGLITGLLGINVGGIPGTDSHWGFTIVCVLMAALAVMQVLLFRRMRFF